MKDKRTAKLYESLTNVDDRFIQEASEIPMIKKKKVSVRTKWGALAACFCLLVTGTCIWHFSSVPSGNPSHGDIQIGTDAARHGKIQAEGNTPQKPVSVSLSSVTFNEISDQQLDASRLWMDPELYEKVFWDENAVREYYGRDLVPAYIPDGLLAGIGNGTGNAYIRKSDGKVIEDEMGLNFYHAYYDDGSPKLTDDVAAVKGFDIRVSRLGIIGCCLYILPENEVKTSDIGGTSVTFGYRLMPYGPYDPETHEPSGYYDLYVAEFKFEGIEYKIVTEQLEEKEIVKIVSSIIFGEKEINIQK